MESAQGDRHPRQPIADTLKKVDERLDEAERERVADA